MSRPFNVQFLAQIKRQLNAFADHLVDDHAVVDATNLNLPAAAIVVQLSSLLLELQNIYGFDCAQLFGQEEIWQRLLLHGINFHEDDVLRSVPAEDGTAEELAIGIVI